VGRRPAGVERPAGGAAGQRRGKWKKEGWCSQFGRPAWSMSAGGGVDDAQTLGGGAGPRARVRGGKGEPRGDGPRKANRFLNQWYQVH
jgi:hypothetical protein